MRLLTMLAGAIGLALLFSGWTATSGPRQSRPAMRWLAQRGFSPREGLRLGALSVAAGVVAALLGLAVSGLLPLAIVAAVAAAPMPFARSQASRRRRREEMSEAWPDALGNVIAGIRAGMSLPECCCALASRGPTALQSGFSAFAATYRACMSFQAGLERLRDQLQDPITDRVTLVLGLADDVGGTDLVRILRATSDFIREDLRTRAEVRARWSWTVNAARLAAGTPFAVLVLMGLRPEARFAYSRPAGAMTIAVGSLLTLAGYGLMLRAARLPQERRLG